MLGDVTPWWLPTCASRVGPTVTAVEAPSSAPEMDRAALDPKALPGDPADRLDQHPALLDLDPLVQRLDVVVVAQKIVSKLQPAREETRAEVA